MIFHTERKIGLQRLASAEGVVYAGKRGMKRTRNAARNGRTAVEGASAKANNLSPAEQRDANQRMAVFGMVEYLSQEKVIRRMPERQPAKEEGAEYLKQALGLDG